jgi:hypothetical protein
MAPFASLPAVLGHVAITTGPPCNVLPRFQQAAFGQAALAQRVAAQ